MNIISFRKHYTNVYTFSYHVQNYNKSFSLLRTNNLTFLSQTLKYGYFLTLSSYVKMCFYNYYTENNILCTPALTNR